MNAVRLLLGTVLVAVAATLAGNLVAAATLPYGVPGEAVGVLTIAVTVLGCGLGTAFAARRWPAGTVTEHAAGLIAPLGLGLVIVLYSTTPLWFRMLAAVAFLAAGLLGLRVGTRDAREPAYARRRPETGSGSLEYVGIAILAAVLVVASVGATASSSPAIRDTIWAKICQITGGSSCGAASMPSNADYKPADCDIYSSEKKLSATVDITFVRLGGGAVVQRTEKSNGDVEITVLQEGRGGAVASVGGHGKLKIGKTSLGVDAEAEASATGGVQIGQTYVFDDKLKADAFQNYIQGEVVEDIATSANPLLKGANWLKETVTKEEPPENDGVRKEFTQFDVKAGASGEASLGFGASAGAELEAMVALGVETDRGKDRDDPADDKQTTYFQVDWAAAFNLGLPVVKGVDANGAGSGIIKVTTDASGGPAEVQIISRSEGSFEFGLDADEKSTAPVGQTRAPNGLESFGLDFKAGPNSSTVVTQTVSLDTPERQQAFLGWLSAAGGANLSGTAALTSGPADSESGANVTSIGGGEDFAKLMAEHASVSVVQYDGTTWGIGGGAGLGLGVKGSIDVGYDTKDARAVKAAYLGAPDANGQRTAFDLPECVA